MFKGGTSLSKAFGLIRRFSEDVDVIVMAPGHSTGQDDRCLKSFVAATAAAKLDTSNRPVGKDSPRRRHSTRTCRDRRGRPSTRSCSDQLLWPSAPRPSFEDCCAAVHRHSGVI